MKCSNLVFSVLLQFVIHNASQNAFPDMPRLDVGLSVNCFSKLKYFLGCPQIYQRNKHCAPIPHDVFVLIPCSNAASALDV